MKLSNYPGTRRLLHLSFDKTLGGIIRPQVPAGYTTGGKFKEPNHPRICLSDNIVGALQAIYPNIYHYFEQDGYPHMDFHLYTCSIVRRDDLVLPAVLSKLGFVHDAHITGEHWLLDTSAFKLAPHKVRLYNPADVPDLFYVPFNKPNGKHQRLGPDLSRATIKVISR